MLNILYWWAVVQPFWEKNVTVVKENVITVKIHLSFLLLSLSFYCWAECHRMGLLFGQVESAGSPPSTPHLLSRNKVWKNNLLQCKLCSQAMQPLLCYQHCCSCQFKAQQPTGKLSPPQPAPLQQDGHWNRWVRHRTCQGLQPSEAADECQLGCSEAPKAKISSYFRRAYVL